MALKTVHSSNITFMDTTDDRKLDVYISSNHPTVQLYNSNTKVYTPDWSITSLQLDAEIYIDSKDVTSNSQTEIGWYEKIGTTETLIGTGASISIPNNALEINPIITYVCKAEYQGIKALSQQTFTRVDTGVDGVDGTSVNIKGTATSITTVDDTDYYTLAYNETLLINSELGDAYMYAGHLYVCTVVNSDADYFLDIGRIQGPAGKDAKHIILSGSAQVFKVSKTNIITPATITVVAQAFNTEVAFWTYSTNGGQEFLSDVPAGVSRNGDIITITGSDVITNSLVIKASDGEVEDIFTIYKAFDGFDGTPGTQGDPAPIVFLTNENMSFSANSNGQAYATSITTNVVAYNGMEKVLPTIGAVLISYAPDGMKIAVDEEATALADNEIVLKLTIEKDATLGSALSTSGEIAIPIISPVNTILKLNWSKINTGFVGEPGNDAVTFQVYSSNGYTLSANTPTVTLQTFAYIGDSEITAGAIYQWYTYIDNEWSPISEETFAYLDVSREDVSFSKNYMCKMKFNGVEYAGVVTINDKNDENMVFTAKPSAYTAGDLWIVGADYAPTGVETGTLLRAEHTNHIYTDSDWTTATKYDEKIEKLKNNIDIYNQYFSFDSSDGLKISARDSSGAVSDFSTSLTNERLSFNYGDQAVAYIDGTKMNIKEAEIESPLTVTGRYSGSTMQQAPVINIGNFSIVVESNGSLSIIANT